MSDEKHHVFVVSLKAPDGTTEQREFIVRDQRLANILRKILFDKTATSEEMEAFAVEVDNDPELAKEWHEVQKHLQKPWTRH